MFLDHTDTIAPHHHGNLAVWLAACGLFTAAGAAVGWFRNAGPVTVGERIMACVDLASYGGLCAFLGTPGILVSVHNAIDFPAGRTRVIPDVLMMVGRAYQTHGKSTHRSIQTMPLRSNLDISEDDYAFMLAHRRPGDTGADADEIASKGWFCARVTLEASDTALRVLSELPQGSIRLCPARTAPGTHFLDVQGERVVITGIPASR